MVNFKLLNPDLGDGEFRVKLPGFPRCSCPVGARVLYRTSGAG
jgi:hypothetical protein